MLYFGLDDGVELIIKDVRIEKRDLERFWKYVDVKSDDECWMWKGRIVASKNGYGLFDIRGLTLSGEKKKITTEAHRFITHVKHKEIPPGMVAAHSCNNNMCVNPHHLSILSNEENLRNAAKDRLHILPPEERSKIKFLSEQETTEILDQLNVIVGKYNINKLTLIRLLERNTLPKIEYYAW